MIIVEEAITIPNFNSGYKNKLMLNFDEYFKIKPIYPNLIVNLVSLSCKIDLSFFLNFDEFNTDSSFVKSVELAFKFPAEKFQNCKFLKLKKIRLY